MTRILYFTAEWCRPCRTFGPRLKAEADTRGLALERVDIDRDTTTSTLYRVQSVPTVVIERDGEVVDRFGALPAPQLRERLDALTA